MLIYFKKASNYEFIKDCFQYTKIIVVKSVTFPSVIPHKEYDMIFKVIIWFKKFLNNVVKYV